MYAQLSQTLVLNLTLALTLALAPNLTLTLTLTLTPTLALALILTPTLALTLTAIPKVVLFIDELHTIMGAGATGQGASDAAQILKPSLARGDLHLVGATTLDEYRRHIEKDQVSAWGIYIYCRDFRQLPITSGCF